jgi:hypothetical protein
VRHLPSLRPWPIRAAALLALGLLPACSNDSAVHATKALGNVTQADAGALADPVPTLVASAHPDKGPYVELEGEWHADIGMVTARVFIANFPAVYGVAGHLRYDPEGLELAKLTMSDVPKGLASDAQTWTARSVGKEVPAGRILLGGARIALHPHPFLPLEGAKVGRELWATAQFRVKKPGDFKLSFDPDHDVARGVDGKDQAATWGSATVTITQMPKEVAP